MASTSIRCGGFYESFVFTPVPDRCAELQRGARRRRCRRIRDRDFEDRDFNDYDAGNRDARERDTKDCDAKEHDTQGHEETSAGHRNEARARQALEMGP